MSTTTRTASISRREFLGQGALYGSGFWLFISLPRPLALQAAQQSDSAAALDEHEWQTVEAITGRVIPADHEPGAVDANCVNFIDKALAHEDAELLPRYKTGVLGIDALAMKRFGDEFIALSPDRQDTVLGLLEAGGPDGWPEGGLSSSDFFETIRAHTITSFLADPRYGGNRDYIGWKVVGYPGPRHAHGGYTTEQMLGTQRIRAIWGEEL